jgi:histidinol phosphatase-like enzyme
VPLQFKDDPRWQQEWRKPNGGMIREAMKWAKLGPLQGAKVLMIGDMDSDEGAAKSANVRFQRAPYFFTGLDKVDF